MYTYACVHTYRYTEASTHRQTNRCAYTYTLCIHAGRDTHAYIQTYTEIHTDTYMHVGIYTEI